MKKLFLSIALSVFSALFIFAEDQRPNVVFILIDDMGFSDIGLNGAEFYETPNIDALAAQGMNFTNAYTSVSICAPARASAMTGKHPCKLKMWNHFHHMPSGTKTVASYLKEAGYATWHVGKWHCGSPDNNTLPQDVGFDVNIGGWESWAPASYFWPYKRNRNIPEDKVPTRARVPGLEKGGKEGEYLSDRLTDEAIKLIKNHDGKKPFFLNMWHYAVHEPLQAKASDIEKYKEKAKKYLGRDMSYSYDAKGTKYFSNPNMAPLMKAPKGAEAQNSCVVYAAMIDNLDQNIGRLVQALKDEGYYDNTLIIFFSDNGPTTHRVIRTPFRGGKNSTYQGGIRQPAFMVWKGKILSASANDSFVNICDLSYTMLDAAGSSFPEGYDGDGKSLLPLAKGDVKKFEDRDFVWYFPSTRTHWGQYASAAIKCGNLKYQMLFNGDSDELYDLNSDPTESNNIISSNAQKASQMELKLREFLNKYYKDMPLPDEIYIDNVSRRLRGEPALKVTDKNY